MSITDMKIRICNFSMTAAAHGIISNVDDLPMQETGDNYIAKCIRELKCSKY